MYLNIEIYELYQDKKIPRKVFHLKLRYLFTRKNFIQNEKLMLKNVRKCKKMQYFKGEFINILSKKEVSQK